MGILALAADERIANVDISEDELIVRLRDGRKISVPLAWYPRLLKARPEQRTAWRITGGGYGIHWEAIDEDLSTEGLLRGAPAARPNIHLSIRGEGNEIEAKFPLKKLEPISESSVPEEDDDAEKGILDHVIEAEEATAELVKVLSWIEFETNSFTTKISKHTSNIERFLKRPGGSSAKDYKTVVLLTASDMNAFSSRVDEVLPGFEENTKLLEESYSVYVQFATPDSPDDVKRIDNLRNSLSQMLSVLRPAKENIAKFRDSTLSIRSQNINKELNKAATRQSKTLDNVLSETERVESFALRIGFLINEKFG